MDINAIISAITTVGFPIVACGALFWLVNKLNDTHREEVSALRDVLERNTESIIKLKEFLKSREEKSNGNS